MEGGNRYNRTAPQTVVIKEGKSPVKSKELAVVLWEVNEGGRETDMKVEKVLLSLFPFCRATCLTTLSCKLTPESKLRILEHYCPSITFVQVAAKGGTVGNSSGLREIMAWLELLYA